MPSTATRSRMSLFGASIACCLMACESSQTPAGRGAIAGNGTGTAGMMEAQGSSGVQGTTIPPDADAGAFQGGGTAGVNAAGAGGADASVADCMGLGGEALADCCAAAAAGGKATPDACVVATASPECLEMFTTSPSATKYAVQLPSACTQCLCTKCAAPTQTVRGLGAAAEAMLACGHAHATSRQCLVCNAPCDTATGSNVAQGPCWQEACSAAGVACAAGNPLSFQDLIPKCEQSAPEANGCAAVYGATACMEVSPRRAPS